MWCQSQAPTVTTCIDLVLFRLKEWGQNFPWSTFSTRHSSNPIVSPCSTNHIKNSPWHSCGFWYKWFSGNWSIYSLAGCWSSEDGADGGGPPICRTLQWTCPSRARTETQLWPEQGLVSCFVPEDLEQDQEQSNSYHLTAKPCTNLGTIVSLIARDLWMGTKYCRISAKISPGAPLSHSSSLTRGDVDSDRPDRIMLSCDFFFPFFFFFS